MQDRQPRPDHAESAERPASSEVHAAAPSDLDHRNQREHQAQPSAERHAQPITPDSADRSEPVAGLGPPLSFSDLWKNPVILDTSKTPVQAWIRHTSLMFALYVLISVPLGLMAQELQILFFWWIFAGIGVGVQVVHRRVRRHVPLVVDTFPRAMKFFAMILCWPVLLK